MSTRRSSRKSIANISPQDGTMNPAPVETSALRSRSSKPRITPRNSIADEAIAAAATETPYNTLHQLANIIPRPTTPLRRASSAGPPSTHRSTRRIPGLQERTPGGASAPGSLRRPNALTPHARAAIREDERRRAAALTPGKDRLRSDRQQRETPRDGLRALSRILARDTKPVEPSPQADVLSGEKVLIRGQDDLDDGPEPQPRLSMPLDEEEEDSLLLPLLRSAGFMEDENFTQGSIELPRRAVSVQPGGKLSRGSFGSIRTSDQFGELNELGLDALSAAGNDSSFIQQGDFEDHDVVNVEEEAEATGNLRRPYLEDRTGRVSLASGRTSDIRPQAFTEDDTETTFLLPVPLRDSLPGRPSIPGYAESFQAEHEYGNPKNQSADVDDLEDSEIDQVDAEDVNMRDPTPVETERLPRGRRKDHKIKKRIKISRYGIQYHSLPAGVVKKLATTFLRTTGNSNAKLSKDTLEAIMQASDWFFEQVSDDLGIYAQHAGRKTVDENDVFTLMKRQRQTNTTTTPFALAQRYLPRELLQDLRMAPPPKLKKSRQLETVEEEEYDEE